ncbi:MAG: hypothetical protein E6Q75_02590 [Rheinheimera sp.]|nr:MAG: hypothetical protein E6Q75_02590 [Rheinheimera sp.]
MSTKMLQAAFALSALFCFSAQAAVIPADGKIYTNCSAVTLNYVGSPITNALALGEVYNATSCKGKSGNDPAYDLNIGLFGDGLLNGGSLGQTQVFTGYEFADWVYDPVLEVLKPGWIGLARADNDTNTISYNTVNGVDLHPFIFGNVNYGNIFDLTFGYTNDLSGTWRLQVNAAALVAAKALLGNSYFDHLNIVLKGGTTGFMSYNFDFNKIFDIHNALDQSPVDDLSLSNNYTLGGTWSTADLLQSQVKCDKINTNEGKGPPVWEDVNCRTEYIQQGLSHATFAAHDPLTTTDIPAPAPLGLLGLSVLGMVIARRRRV